MLIPSLVLPSVAADGVSARRRLGCGLQLRFQVNGEEGLLRLEPGPAPTGVEPLCFDTARGVVACMVPRYPVIIMPTMSSGMMKIAAMRPICSALARLIAAASATGSTTVTSGGSWGMVCEVMLNSNS